ncbi:MAG: polyprenyl synthetase family protein [Kiritimatiellia bacterium]
MTDGEVTSLQEILQKTIPLIDAELERLVPSATEAPERLHAAMRHSLFGAGKRLRPVICLAAAEACNGDPAEAMPTACAVEILHTYTLIHDDLPAMDDDDLRRGRPTCHIAFDEATAILAGDALLTLSFEILSKASARPPYSAVDLVRELATASGSRGVIGGQMADIEGEGKPMQLEQLRYIHNRKTGDLIRAAARMGAMVAGASDAALAALTHYAENIGLAFQIADDVLNATGSAAALGKSTGTDEAAGKLTYVSAYGVEGAKHEAERLVAEAIAQLSALPADTTSLEALARYVIERSR